MELHWIKQQSDLDLLKIIKQLPLIERIKPENIKLYWYCADDERSGFLHSRGLFTAKGGLIYDRGFAEPGDRDQRQELTDITPMPTDLLHAKANSYNTSLQYDDFKLVRGVWSSHP
ncbi:hypothetical protein GCM10007855_12500 [Aliivibrio sifiae]|uniref:Uncharacterized protein n=1 Tax=Aliivibrio sifiae TaxID=566293 RepID=A0ABQ6ADP3_9GAMM|nr:hypothetical protein GCM10007855_12500 [Aliivibrio sifiae]